MGLPVGRRSAWCEWSEGNPVERKIREGKETAMMPLIFRNGMVLCRYQKEDGTEASRYLEKNEMVQVGTSIHTFENDTDETVEFIVFRFVPDGTDKREMIKGDKKTYKP